MTSRVYRAIENRRNKALGGRGMKATNTRVMRVPEDILSELDNLIQDYKQRSIDSPTSPRYHFLNHFISELDGILLQDRE